MQIPLEWISSIRITQLNWEFISNTDSVEYLNKVDITIDFFFHDSCHEIDYIRKEWIAVKDKIRIFSAHNSNGRKCRPFFFGEEYTKEFKLLAGKGTLGLWQKK